MSSSTNASAPLPDLRGQVTRSIERTLISEARKNELTIAGVRAATLCGLLGVEFWLLGGGSRLDVWAYPLAGLSFGMMLWSLWLWRYLQKGGWHRTIPWVVPAIDATYFLIRQGVPLWITGSQHFLDVQDLATVVGMACLLTITGAFRLSARTVVYCGLLGLALYLVFATAVELELFFVTVHLLLVSAVAMASLGLTAIVQRAVQAEVVRLTISRLLPAPVLAAADSDPIALLSEPRSLNATVVVTDIRGFTQWAEHRDPMEVLAFLNQIQGGLAEIVQRHQGVVDKFMGDGMLAVFGAPHPMSDHASRALDAVREMLVLVDTFTDVDVGIGVHTGEVVVGCLGTGLRMEFTVLGDTVNTASRLESKTKELGIPVVFSVTTQDQLAESLVPIGAVEIRGREQRIELFGLRDVLR